MNCRSIIQAILDKVGGATYLEIGVAGGETFFTVRAERKFGMDPRISVSGKHGMPGIIYNMPLLLRRKGLFKMPSDMFFKKKGRLFLENKIDVAFIDGLHTYSQSLRDVANCLEYLNEKGFILMDDCNPSSENVGYPAPNYDAACKLNLPGWDGQWSGDVWKTIVYLRSQRKDLLVFVLDCDYGIGIITRGGPENMLQYPANDILKMDYRCLADGRKELLNLKAADYLDEFLENYKNEG